MFIGFDNLLRRFAKPLIWCCALFPIFWLGWTTFSGQLGANPIEFVNRYLGETALKLLVISLAITPLRIITGWVSVIRYRRLLGLFAFFYAVLHFCFYVSVEQFFSWSDIWQDLVKRKYITLGFIALLLLIPLAVTSTKLMIKRLGAKSWKKLHRVVYLAAVLACLHFFMMRKGIQLEPIYYLVFLFSMYIARVLDYFRNKT